MCDHSYVQSQMSPHLIGVADVTQCGPAGLARRGVPWDDSCSRENVLNMFTFPPTTTPHFPSESLLKSHKSNTQVQYNYILCHFYTNTQNDDKTS